MLETKPVIACSCRSYFVHGVEFSYFTANDEVQVRVLLLPQYGSIA